MLYHKIIVFAPWIDLFNNNNNNNLRNIFQDLKDLSFWIILFSYIFNKILSVFVSYRNQLFNYPIIQNNNDIFQACSKSLLFQIGIIQKFFELLYQNVDKKWGRFSGERRGKGDHFSLNRERRCRHEQKCGRRNTRWKTKLAVGSSVGGERISGWFSTQIICGVQSQLSRRIAKAVPFRSNLLDILETAERTSAIRVDWLIDERRLYRVT